MSDNIIQMFKENNSNFDVQIFVNDDEDIIGVSSPDWTFKIIRDGNNVAFVCKETDEPFGILPREAFNYILCHWLLADDQELIETAASIGSAER